MKQPKPKYQQPPTSYGVVNKTKTAKISGNSQGMRVQHREFISDVLGAVNFTVSSRPINPGLVTTFPWLALIAANFEKYKFRKLHFVYESSVATTAAGVVLSAIDTDAADPPPISKQAMMSYECSERSNVWMTHTTRMPIQQPMLYVRTGPVPAGSDVKTYDAGNVFVASQGAASAAAIGELYVEYDVDLYVPQLTANPIVSSLNINSLSTPINFNSAVYTGQLPYLPISTQNQRLGIYLSPGQQVMIAMTFNNAVATQTGSIAPVSFLGSSGTVITTNTAAGSIGPQSINTILSCTTSSSVSPTAGYFFIDFPSTNNYSVAEIFITYWQAGAAV